MVTVKATGAQEIASIEIDPSVIDVDEKEMLQDLVTEAGDLWPPHPDRIPDLEDWIVVDRNRFERSQSKDTADDYFLAGRNLGWFARTQRVMLSHDALQLGELADHLGEQIALAQLPGSPGELHLVRRQTHGDGHVAAQGSPGALQRDPYG